MALSNMGREPRREWTEQGFGVLFILGYVIWGIVCSRLSVLIYPLEKCGEFYSDGFCDHRYHINYWTDPGNPAIWIGLMVSPWLLIPLWYLIHELGEMTCSIMTSMGFDPRPVRRRYGGDDV